MPAAAMPPADAPVLPQWEPILDGELRAQAQAYLEDFADRVAGASAGALREITGHLPLASFVVGTALQRQEMVDASVEQLQNLLDVIGARGGHMSLLYGLACVGSMVMALEPADPNDDEPGVCEDLDEALTQAIGSLDARHNWDLISGVSGVGLYAVTRPWQPSAVALAEACAAWLETHAVNHEGMLTWRRHPDVLPEHQRKLAPDGKIDLGLAHGVGGAVMFLAERMLKRGEGRELLASATAFLRVQAGPASEGGRFGPDMGTYRCRTAWCYGDLGLSFVLARAGEALGDADLSAFALQLAEETAARWSKGVQDAALCHGAAGNAHFFNRWYAATGRDIFAEAARIGFAAVPSLPTWWDRIKGAPVDDGLSYLEGRMGIALAYATAAFGVPPGWDALLGMAGADKRC